MKEILSRNSRVTPNCWKLQENTFKTKYINTKNSSNSFLLEMKRWWVAKNRVETAGGGKDFLSFCNHPFVVFPEVTFTFTTKGINKIKFMKKLCKQFPMITLQSAGLKLDLRKCWNNIATKTINVPVLEKLNSLYHLCRSDIVQINYFLHKYQTCQRLQKTFVLPRQWFLRCALVQI